ncbi:MAG: sigma-54-dependent Fis family transcriptional regulator, partial [Myxococcota bacterium]
MDELRAGKNDDDEGLREALLVALGELVRKEISAWQLMQRMIEVVADLLCADRGTIYLFNEAGDELVSVAAQLPEMEEIRVPLSQGVAGYVARTGRVVNIPFCESDVRFWREVDARTGYTTRSTLAGPLRDTDDNIIGVVQLLNKKGEGAIFTEEDEQTLATLARQVAVLLEETTIRFAPPMARPTPRPSEALPLGDRINRVLGSGPKMRHVFQSIRRVAPTEANVLIIGESGTGKSLVARALHHNSMRASGPFVQVNCTTLPDGLMENELFGHERGAYTGAHTNKPGKVEAATGGTLFLDEIGDLPLALQGKLLTLLQERTYYRVGATRHRTADIRIITATNRDLAERVQQGLFREDLYYRLRVVQIHMPPLRDRGRDDLLQLIDHFVAQACRRHTKAITQVRPDALDMLVGHDWPGNVRELENCIESAVIFADQVITPSTLSLPRPNSTLELRAVDLERALRPSKRAVAEDTPSLLYADEPTLKELEARYIAHLLKRYEGNRSACARAL